MSRLIPLLTTQNSRLVKTKRFSFYKYLGDPVNAVELFGKLEVDELVLLDISENFQEASLIDMLRRLSDMALMPITYGGHVMNYDFAQKVFGLGFDRVVIRRALKDVSLIKRLISNYGSSSITASIDVIKLSSGGFILNGHQVETNGITTYLRGIIDLGVGQLLLNYCEKDGMRTGLEYDFVQSLIQEICTLPIVISGGCKSKDEATSFMDSHNGVSVAASSIFTLIEPNDAVLIRY